MWIGNDRIMKEELIKILNKLLGKDMHVANFKLLNNCYGKDRDAYCGNFELVFMPFDFIDEDLEIEEDDIARLYANPVTALFFKDFGLDIIAEESTEENEVWGFFFNLTEAGKQYLLNKCMEE